MNKKTCLLTCCLLLLLSCNTNTTKIFKINIASSVSHSRLPAQAVQIDSALHYQYFGGEFSEHKGYYYGKYDIKGWKEMVKAFNKVNWDKLQNARSENFEDWPIEIIIHTSEGKKHIRTYYEHLPLELKKISKQLLESPKQVKLVKSPVKLDFETKYQNLNSGQPKFPPATK